MHSGRWTHLIYSSFQSAAGGGWQIGDDTGAGAQDRELAREHAVTTLTPQEPVDEFISTRKIEALPRRCDYHVLDEQCVFVHALPAGRDSTHRPGNVFSHVVIDHAPGSPTQAYPIQWYRSRDILQPFGARAVNDAALPAELGEPAASEIGDIFAAWMLVRNMGEDRIGAIYQLQNLLTTNSRTAILVTSNTDEAATWITALSSTLSQATAVHYLQFSTFTRAQELTERREPTLPALLAVPHYDRELIPAQFLSLVVDPADSSTWGQPSSPWATATAAALAQGVDETELPTVLADQVWWESEASDDLSSEAAQWVSRMTEPQLFREVSYWNTRDPLSDFRNFAQLETHIRRQLASQITGEAALIPALRNSWALYLHPGLSERPERAPLIDLIDWLAEQLPLATPEQWERLENTGKSITHNNWFQQNYLQSTVLQNRLATDLPRSKNLRHLAADSGFLAPSEKEKF